MDTLFIIAAIFFTGFLAGSHEDKQFLLWPALLSFAGGLAKWLIPMF